MVVDKTLSLVRNARIAEHGRCGLSGTDSLYPKIIDSKMIDPECIKCRIVPSPYTIYIVRICAVPLGIVSYHPSLFVIRHS
jgi:hypothetical protein